MRRFALACLWCVLGLLLPAVACAQGPVTGKKVQLAIVEFKMRSGAARFEVLREAIPAIVHAVALSDERVQVATPSEVSLRLVRAGLSGGAVWDRERPSTEQARAMEADYLLAGSFLEIQGEVVITGTLHDLNNIAPPQRLDPVRVDEASIVGGVESLAKAVLGRMRGTSAVVEKTIGIACLEDRSQEPGEGSRAARRDLALYLTGRLGARKGVRVVKWAEMEKYCQQSIPDPKLARAVKADAIIGGVLTLTGDEKLHILPSLFVAENNSRFEMAAITRPIAEYFELKEQLHRAVRLVLDGALTPEGTWELSKLAGKSSPEGDARRGREYLTNGQVDLAALYLERAAAAGASEVLVDLGLAQYRRGNYKEAVESLRAYAAKHGDSPRVQELLGNAYTAQRQYAEALAAFRSLLASKPDDAAAKILIGNVYFRQGKLDDAGRTYLEVLQADPRDVTAKFNLGLVYQRQGRMGEAIGAFQSVLVIEPGNADARRGLANLYLDLGDKAHREGAYDKAIDAYSSSIEYQASAQGYFGRGLARAYLLAGHPSPEYVKVAADYEEAGRMAGGVDKDTADNSMLNLLEALVLASQFERAGELAQRYLAKAPSGYDAIAQYFIVVSQVLTGADHRPELNALRRVLDKYGRQLSFWDFSLLDRYYRESDRIRGTQRDTVIKITEDLKRGPAKQSK